MNQHTPVQTKPDSGLKTPDPGLNRVPLYNCIGGGGKLVDDPVRKGASDGQSRIEGTRNPVGSERTVSGPGRSTYRGRSGRGAASGRGICPSVPWQGR